MDHAHDDHGHGDVRRACSCCAMGHDDHGTMITTTITTLPSRPRSARVRRADHRRSLVVSAVLSWMTFVDVAFNASRCPHRAAELDQFRRPAAVLDAARRHADRRDAGRRHHGVVARAHLFARLHGRRSEPAALHGVSVAVHLHDADAGDRGQPAAAVLRLGRRRSGQLPADRLLVQEALGQCAAAIKAFVVNRVGDFGFLLGIFALFMLRLDRSRQIFAAAPA
jgi:NADH-quinone oxidoreductase subunit L